jgi:Na+-transporting NADH:ubiquinone oxidoreductase subunit NqrC
MAQQTKTKSRAGSGARSNRRTSANGRTAAKSRSSASRSQTTRTPKRKASSSSQKRTLDAAKDATTKGAKVAGNAVTSTAKKLKTPLIAAGTGLAGVAAGIAVTRKKNKGISGIHLPSRGTTKGLGEAAKNIGMLAERTGKVAQQVRVASEAIGEGGAPRKSKSAIEVVLEGLTSRRQSKAG